MSAFLALLGSLRTKAALRKLTKLIPGGPRDKSNPSMRFIKLKQYTLVSLSGRGLGSTMSTIYRTRYRAKAGTKSLYKGPITNFTWKGGGSRYQASAR